MQWIREAEEINAILSRNKIKIVRKILKDIRNKNHLNPRLGPLQYAESYKIK